MMSFLSMHNKLMHRLIEIDIWAWFAFLTPVLCFIQEYLYNDWNFLSSLLILMALDIVTGVAKAYKLGKIVTSTGLRDTLIKVFQYGVSLIVIHILVSFQIDGEEVSILDYADEAGYTFLIVIEAKSIFENLHVVDGRVDFTGIIDKLKTMLPTKKDK